MEFKFLDQDVDVVSLANKGIVIGCFVGRNYNKILMETGKLTDNIRVTKNGLGYGLDRMFQSSDSVLYHFTKIDVCRNLNHGERHMVRICHAIRKALLQETHMTNIYSRSVMAQYCFKLQTNRQTD